MDISSYIPNAAITPPSASTGKSSGAPSGKDAKLMDSCRQFEGQFFDMMLQEMRKTVPDDPIMGDDSHEEQIFQGMMDDNIAQEMAKHAGSNDLAAQMYRQLAAKSAAGAASAAKPAQPSPVSPQPLSIAAKSAPILKKSTITPENREQNDSDTSKQ